MTPVQPSPAESGGREVRGDLNPIPGQLALPGMPPFPGARNGQPTLPGLDDLTDPAGAGDAELAAVAAELAAVDADGARMGAAIRGALDMLLDGQHTGRYRWEQLHKTDTFYPKSRISRSQACRHLLALSAASETLLNPGQHAQCWLGSHHGEGAERAR